MPLSSYSIQKFFGPKGLLARSLESFECRSSQIQMARLVQEALELNTTAIIEAGTGTGKTLGYLVPVILSGKKTVISTGTKNLQEQIFLKDIPLLASATGEKIQALLMKGRKNYLCLHRYFQNMAQPSLLRPDLGPVKKRIDKWLKKTTFADRAELSWMKDDDPLWDAMSASSEQCLGVQCDYRDECYLDRLRKEAARSRLIIVNHHLFFADLMVKEGGFGEIIPRFQAALFDEAHAVEEIATTYFGLRWSTHQARDLIQDLEKNTELLKTKGKKTIRTRIDLIKTGIEKLIRIFDGMEVRGKLDDEALQAIQQGPVRILQEGFAFPPGINHSEPSENKTFTALADRARELKETLELILTIRESGWITWFEKRKRSLILHASPLDISQNLKERLYGKVKCLLFTSATLSTNGHFKYIQSRLGLPQETIQGIFPSHFHFETQTLLYIPKDLPLPTDPDFIPKITNRMVELFKITTGRALVLFTSYHNLNAVHRLIEAHIPYRVFRQGDAPKTVLLDAFKDDTHSILLATGSFWQGVDVPGESLSCLIVDKLPFGSPGDPLVSARIDELRSQGRNPFMEYQLPSAIIALKQGLGRLIRGAKDRGLLSILDRRLVDQRYGRYFFDSLPPLPLCHDLTQVAHFFDTTPKAPEK
jgi:ATP-dependent DNA helicase DinG